MPRGVEARGSIGTPGVPRALGSLSGGRKKFALQAVPAPVQKFRAMTLVSKFIPSPTARASFEASSGEGGMPKDNAGEDTWPHL